LIAGTRIIMPDDQPSKTGEDRSQSNLELFFDLVFVFAMSQVTQLMLSDVSWLGFGHGVLALLAVWWAWVGYTWLTNSFWNTDLAHSSGMIAAMAAMLVAATALPTAFTTGALVFGLALLAVRLIHALQLLFWAWRDSDDVRRVISRMTPAFVGAPALIVAAAFMSSPYRELLWIAAACIDYGAPILSGMAGLRVVPTHFVERHGSMIIIALGEAIVELGTGSRDVQKPGVVACLVLGVLIAATLWWTYFGLTIGAKERLRQAHGIERAELARDAYSYLHLLLVTGIVFFAVGAHAAAAHFAAPLKPLPAAALSGGVALFYLGDVAYRWRDHHQLTVDRLLTGGTSLAVLPLAPHIPAVVLLVMLCAIGTLRLAWELWRRPRVGPTIAGKIH
jgi:low temperature requirement protein LtrA